MARHLGVRVSRSEQPTAHSNRWRQLEPALNHQSTNGKLLVSHSSSSSLDDLPCDRLTTFVTRGLHGNRDRLNIPLSTLDEHFAETWQSYGSDCQRTARRRRGLPMCRLVRYADDWVVTVSGTRQHADALRVEAAAVLAPMGLRLSETKTQVVHIDEGFDFLGWHIQRRRKRGTDRNVVYTSKKALASIVDKVRAITGRSKHRHLSDLLRQLNSVMRGWCAYFRHGVSAATFGYLDEYSWHRVTRWLRKRHPHVQWASLIRRFLPGKRPTEDGISLFQPQKVPVVRYRYRGRNIPTPWTPLPAAIG